MLLRKQKYSARPQQSEYRAGQRFKILHIMHGKGAVDEVERAVLQRPQGLQIHKAVFDDALRVRGFARDGEHLLTAVKAQNPFRAASCKFKAVFPRPAPQVQNLQPLYVGEQGAHGRLLEQRVVIARIAPQRVVSLKEFRIVEYVAAHTVLRSFLELRRLKVL